jgi:hypothetical protein
MDQKGRGRGGDEVNGLAWRIVIATVVVSVALPATTTDGQEPDERLFEGAWSLEFSAATRPGGETLPAGVGTISPQNLLFSARHREFSVSEDGRFAWTERSDGQWHSDARLIVGGQSSHPSQTNEPLLVASGQLDRRRKLTLKLAWTHGSGPFLSGDGTGGALVVSAAADQVSVFFLGKTSTHPVRFLTSEWTLTPQSIEREEVGRDVVRETVQYAARRRQTLTDFQPSPLPVNESIRVRQVRPMKIVPRG